MTHDECIELEVATRKPIVGGVLHPDSCDKLTLNAVTWAIPPKNPPGGVLLCPDFSGDNVGFVAESASDDWPQYPQADEWLELAPDPNCETCETCGGVLGSDIEIDIEKQTQLVSKTFELAAILLRRQYDLTNEQLQGLLTVSDGEFMGLFTDLYIWQSK
jgi:hypothetical protein